MVFLTARSKKNSPRFSHPRPAASDSVRGKKKKKKKMVPIQSGASYTLGYHALLWREACGGKPGFVRRPVKMPPVGRWGPALSRQVGTRLEKHQLP